MARASARKLGNSFAKVPHLGAGIMGGGAVGVGDIARVADITGDVAEALNGKSSGVPHSSSK